MRIRRQMKNAATDNITTCQNPALRAATPGLSHIPAGCAYGRPPARCQQQQRQPTSTTFHVKPCACQNAGRATGLRPCTVDLPANLRILPTFPSPIWQSQLQFPARTIAVGKDHGVFQQLRHSALHDKLLATAAAKALQRITGQSCIWQTPLLRRRSTLSPARCQTRKRYEYPAMNRALN